MQYVNLTPHDVVVYTFDNADPTDIRIAATYPTSGTVARLGERTVVDAFDDHNEVGPEYWPVRDVKLTEPVGLPDPADGTCYIVSMPFLMGLKAANIDRPDCVYPHGQVRDQNGRIIGCESFARIV